jgi:hypothetical protein
VESALSNMIFGGIVSVADRTRDLLRRLTGRR